MMLEYIYPVVLYYGDDPEDYEVKQCHGNISVIQLKKLVYEVELFTEDSNFRLIFGYLQNRWFLCIPGKNYGCEMPCLSDISHNITIMTEHVSCLEYEDATAIAYALKTMANFIYQ